MPDVRAATTDDLPLIGRVLAAAFADDPVWRFLTSSPTQWQTRAAAWFEADARAQMRGHGEVLVDCTPGNGAPETAAPGNAAPRDGAGPNPAVRGAAIWSPPDRWKGTAREAVAIALPSVRLFRSKLPRAIRLLTQMERAHPSDPPHWHLAVLGTDPAHQGTGVGSALIRAMTDRCDEQGLGAYLESSKEQNLPFYARHGFEVNERVDPGGQPPTWTMWRDPRP